MGAGPPLHVHHVENEWFCSVYAPKMIPHTWLDVGRVPGKMIVVAQPAGHLEAFTVDLEKLEAAGQRDPAAFKALFEKHDMEIVGPPLPKKRRK